MLKKKIKIKRRKEKRLRKTFKPEGTRPSVTDTVRGVSKEIKKKKIKKKRRNG